MYGTVYGIVAYTWTMSRGASTRRKRGELTRDGLVNAALEVIDREGLDRLTMRRLAQHIGCGTMTVYGHIWDRDDLLTAVLERLLAEIDFHYEPGDTWADVLRRAAGTYFAMVQRHPGAFRLIAYTPTDSTPVTRHLGRATEELHRTGISLESAEALMGIADAFATGFFINQTETEPQSRDADAATSDEPALPTDVDAHLSRRMRDGETWRQGTETIIVGVQKTLGLPAVS